MKADREKNGFAFVGLMLSVMSISVCVNLAYAYAGGTTVPPQGGVELHAHLFMKEGMGWAFNGSFNGPLKATSWEDRFSSQANPEAMDQSGLDIVVAMLYAHPLFTFSLRDSIRRQVGIANRFVQEHPNWVLAKSPQEARTALAAGKHVLILGLEGASGIIESEADLKEFVDQDGIRIVTLFHLTDDHFGGVAFLKGFRIWSSPFAFLSSLIHPLHDSHGNRCNYHGLTEFGREMARSLIQHRVWIDLSHASDASQRDLIPILMEADQPLLYTHTVLRKYHHAERAIRMAELRAVAATGGIIGLMPSEQMLEGTPSKNRCSGSVGALATHFQEVAQVVGESSIGMGSDFNGGIPHLKPSCDTGTSLDQEGFWNISQSQDLWKALKVLGVWHPESKSGNITEKFLKAWDKVWRRGQNN